MPAVFHQPTPPKPAPEAPKIVLLTNAEQVASATDDTLYRALITSGGCGTLLKADALKELMRRADERGYQRGAKATNPA